MKPAEGIALLAARESGPLVRASGAGSYVTKHGKTAHVERAVNALINRGLIEKRKTVSGVAAYYISAKGVAELQRLYQLAKGR